MLGSLTYKKGKTMEKKLEACKLLLDAIHANIEFVSEDNFTSGMEGMAPVVKLQFISEEIEYLEQVLAQASDE